MYDLIGDIHGHADELVQLLEILGYEKSQGSYGRPGIAQRTFTPPLPKERQAAPGNPGTVEA